MSNNNSASNANVGKVFNMTGGGGGSGSLNLQSISVTTPPTKTVYKSGQTFDPSGMIVTADYGYGLTSEVTGYTVEPSVLTDEVQQVVVTYTEGRVTKTTTTPVTVEKVLTGISVTTPPTKTAYDYLESFDPAGMVVTAEFSDGSSEAVEGYAYPTTAFSILGSRPVGLDYTFEGVTKSTTFNVTVNPIEVAVPTQSGSPAYTGGTITPAWNGYDTVKMTLSGDTEGVNAGDYTAKFTLIYGYVFPNGEDVANAPWAIDRATIATLPTQSNALAADTTPKSPEWDGYDVTKMTVSGDLYGTDAGDYTVQFTPKANYKWWDGETGAKSQTWTIASVLVTIPSQSGTLTYDGNPKTPSWDNYDTEHSSVSVNPQTTAGEHSATFSLTVGMWEDGTTGSKIIKWTIDRATIAAVPQQSGSLKYDGNPKTPSWDANYDANKMTLVVEAKTLASTNYSAQFTPDSNHKWWDGTTETKTATWAIGKGDNSISLNPSSLTLNMSARSASFVVSRLGDGVISAVSNNTSVATVGTINQTTGEITINSANDTSGEAVITVSVAEGTNYLAPADKTLNVKASFREYLYGFDINKSDSNPATRVSYPADVENAGFAAAKMTFGGSFSYGSWPSVGGQKFMPRPCMLKFDGTVDYYLKDTDYTKKADGTASDVANMSYGGNAMMEWPKIYVKRWEESGVYHFRCSDVKVDDSYECWSNYDKNNREIPHFYTPIFEGSWDSSNRMRSISGQASKVSTTAQQEIDAAKLNGADIWYTEVAADILLVQDLLVMMFKSTDIQANNGYGRVGSNNAIGTGTMNDKGLFWGSSDKTVGVKAFGMENSWGNIWRRFAGWIYKSGVQYLKITRGTKDGTTATDYNTDGTGYMSVPNSTISGNNYISEMKTMSYGRLPITASGSSTTYEADYTYRATGAGPYYAIVGGSWSYDLLAGPFYVNLGGAPSNTNTAIGAALSCKPLAAA